MNIALILSGGIGSRLASDVPKQYIKVRNRPIISYCIEKISQSQYIDRIQIVAERKWQEPIGKWLQDADVSKKFAGFSKPGENRQLSILNGLEDIAKYASWQDCVFIHDAARPLLSEELIARCIVAMPGHDGVVPVLPMKDTVYLSEDGKRISSLLDRNNVFAGQAPECFVLGKYLEANRRLLPDRIKSINGSTEPAILANMDMAMIPGDETNFKVTTQADLERFCQLMQDISDKKIV